MWGRRGLRRGDGAGQGWPGPKRARIRISPAGYSTAAGAEEGQEGYGDRAGGDAGGVDRAVLAFLEGQPVRVHAEEAGDQGGGQQDGAEDAEGVQGAGGGLGLAVHEFVLKGAAVFGDGAEFVDGGDEAAAGGVVGLAGDPAGQVVDVVAGQALDGHDDALEAGGLAADAAEALADGAEGAVFAVEEVVLDLGGFGVEGGGAAGGVGGEGCEDEVDEFGGACGRAFGAAGAAEGEDAACGGGLGGDDGVVAHDEAPRGEGVGVGGVGEIGHDAHGDVAHGFEAGGFVGVAQEVEGVAWYPAFGGDGRGVGVVAEVDMGPAPIGEAELEHAAVGAGVAGRLVKHRLGPFAFADSLGDGSARAGLAAS